MTSNNPFMQVGIHGAFRFFPSPTSRLRSTVENLPQEAHLTRTAPPRARVELQVRPSPGRGYGLFAVDDIPEFTCVVADDALLSLARGEDLPQLWEKYSLLPQDHREAFDTLSFPPERQEREAGLIAKLTERGHDEMTAEAMAHVSSIFQANAFKTGEATNALDFGTSGCTNIWAYSLFPTVARINHSCTPNAHAHYNPASGQEIVCAIRDIPAGREIEISYFDLTMACEDRQNRARSWGFVCTCPACSDSSALVGDAYELMLGTVHRSLASFTSDMLDQRAHTGDMWHALKNAIAKAESEHHQWLRPALPRLYKSLSVLSGALSRPEDEVERSMETFREWQLKISGSFGS